MEEEKPQEPDETPPETDEEQVLCLGCMRPNSPRASVCVHCSAPIGNAASVANYYRPAPVGVREPDSVDWDDDEEDTGDGGGEAGGGDRIKQPPSKLGLFIGVGGLILLLLVLALWVIYARGGYATF